MLIHSFAINISSGLIFQSNWSAEKNFKINPKLKKVPYKIIYNGGRVFHTDHKKKKREDSCLFVANSNNPHKGFYLFEEFANKSKLSNELKDLKFYAAGNIKSSIKKNKNIKYVGNLNKKELSKIMHRIKYYIHPSIYEACSNALIEAINHGMIPLVYNGTSNVEIVKEDKFKFYNLDQLMNNLKELRKIEDLSRYQLIKFDIDKSAECYLEFFEQISNSINHKISFKNIIIFLWHLYLYQLTLLYHKYKRFLNFFIAKN